MLKMRVVPSQILKESDENNWGLVLNLKSPVLLPEEVIKILASLPDADALAPAWQAQVLSLSAAQSGHYPVFLLFSKTLPSTFHLFLSHESWHQRSGKKDAHASSRPGLHKVNTR